MTVHSADVVFAVVFILVAIVWFASLIIESR